MTQASRDVTKTGTGPHQPTVPEICSPRQRACSVRTGGSGDGGWCGVLCCPASHTATGHSPGRGRQLSLCTHQPRAPGPRGGAAVLLNARQAWQSPRRRPRPRQLAAGHCREGKDRGHYPLGLKGPGKSCGFRRLGAERSGDWRRELKAELERERSRGQGWGIQGQRRKFKRIGKRVKGSRVSSQECRS